MTTSDNDFREKIILDCALTSEQKRAVLEKGKILVSAAAGSGKTSTMVKRILLRICEGVPLRRMLILVYNNAAADELRERLHQALFEAACASSGTQQSIFGKELDELPFAHICTIHGFCQSLIRENFDKLNISPAFKVTDENQHGVYMERALDSVFEEYSLKNDSIFEELSEVFSQARKEDNIKANLKRLYYLMEAQPDRNGFLQTAKESYSDFENGIFAQNILKNLKALSEDALCECESLTEILTQFGQQGYVDNLLLTAARVKALLKAENLTQAYDACAPVEYSRPKCMSKDEMCKAAVERAKSLKKTVDSVLNEFYAQFADIQSLKLAHLQNTTYVSKLLEITLRFDEKLKELKAADNVLSFEDLQQKTVELLKQGGHYAMDYDCIFVDEYQDVNPTQEFIIDSLVRGEAFMVGDVKQSIYGFRLADPDILLARHRLYRQGGGTNIGFNKNFRSGRKILDLVNGIFDFAMTEKSADVDYKNDARFETFGLPPSGSAEIHLFVSSKAGRFEPSGIYDITSHKQAEEAVAAEEREGRFIAKEIKTLVGRAKSEGGFIGYGDIAVLFRSRGSASQTIISVLREEGIPVNEGTFSKNNELPERELMLFLQVLDNPRQDIPLAGYMLSFFGGYNETDLARIAAFEGECFYDKLKACSRGSDALAERLKTTLSALDAYRVKSSFKNVGELMSGIVSDYSYDAYLMREGEAAVQGLKHFLYTAAGRTPVGLHKFLSEYQGSAAPQKAVFGADRVHISTFHGFKGLEKPVVFVADAGCLYSPKTRSGDLIMVGKGYIGLSGFDLERRTKFNTLSRYAVSKMIKERETKEEMRLFYVALTRAKDYLYVTSSLSSSRRDGFGKLPRIAPAGCNLDYVSNALFHGFDAPVFIHTDDDCPTQSRAKNAPPVLGGGDAVTEALIAASQNRKYEYSDSTVLAMKYSVSALDGVDEYSAGLYDEYSNAGTVYHKVMENIDFAAEGTEGVLSELERMLKENILSAQELECVNAKEIARCLESDVIRLTKENRHYREQSFMMYVSAAEVIEGNGSTDKVLVQGVVDLFIDGEQKIIVDFKNSRLSDKKTLLKYKKQLNLYKMALEEAISAKIDRLLLYSFKTGKTVDLTDYT